MTRTRAAPKATICHSAASASGPDTRGYPNTGRCRQTMYVTTFVISDNNACPQKTDPGHDALENMARIGSIDRMDG